MLVMKMEATRWPRPSNRYLEGEEDRRGRKIGEGRKIGGEEDSREEREEREEREGEGRRDEGTGRRERKQRRKREWEKGEGGRGRRERETSLKMLKFYPHSINLESACWSSYFFTPPLSLLPPSIHTPSLTHLCFSGERIATMTVSMFLRSSASCHTAGSASVLSWSHT